MSCGCKKKKTVEPTPLPTPEAPETIEKFHAKEMDAYAKKISEETKDWFDNLDTINPLDDE
jgi:hypothetical protein